MITSVSWAWFVVWIIAIALTTSYIENLVHKQVLPVFAWLCLSTVWAALIVFWFN